MRASLPTEMVNYLLVAVTHAQLVKFTIQLIVMTVMYECATLDFSDSWSPMSVMKTSRRHNLVTGCDNRGDMVALVVMTMLLLWRGRPSKLETPIV